MRCLSCNNALSDFEATRKSAESETYIDLCNKCFDSSDLTEVEVVVRPDLITEDSIEIQDEYEGDDEGDKWYDDYE